MVVLVTGASGQLGQALQSISSQFPEIDFQFFNSSELFKSSCLWRKCNSFRIKTLKLS